jgi:hypothetical protein
MKKMICALLGALLLLCPISANELTQTVRGTIKDRDANIPLIGVTLIIEGSDPVMGTTTDVNGNFKFDRVPVGRINLLITYVGYEEKVIPNITVGSGKEVVLQVEMQESLVSINEVVVRGKNRKKGDVLNEMALLSARSFTVEESQRYAGSLSDPSRMVSSFAGVTSNPEGNNDIVVRGNSPKGILWRLEGVEIPNPNHFSVEGSTGGPINALNSNMLTNSDFFTGAFSPEYGNVLSGVFDMKLRSGNNEHREYTLGVGALGTDITMEGPFKHGYGGSYLMNYRYSSLAMLNDAGVVDFDGVPKYQDGAFKFQLPTEKYGTFSMFGLGGISGINWTDENELTNEVTDKGTEKARMGVIGLNHLYQLNDKAFFKTSVSASLNGSSHDIYGLNDAKEFIQDGKGKMTKKSLRSSIQYSHKLNAKNRLVIGSSYTQLGYEMHYGYYDWDEEQYKRSFDFDKNTGMLQSFASLKHRFTDKLTFVGGLHYMNFRLNKKHSLEPRVGLKWQASPKQSFNIGYGKHSKLENILTYYTVLYRDNGEAYEPNKGLDLSKAHHYVLGYENRITKNLNAKIELYYQDLFNIPVENVDTSYFSMLNADMGYIDKELVNKGTGKNYGIEFSLERYFDNSYYYLFTTSLYESKYKSLEGKERNTKYNGNYAFNLLFGKEFQLNKEKGRSTLGINTKLFYSGGRRYIPLNLDASIAKDDDVYYYDYAWDKRKSEVFQMNLSVNFKFNRKNVSHEIVVDVLNLTNNQAELYEYYNSNTKGLATGKQLALIPNIMYKIYF